MPSAGCKNEISTKAMSRDEPIDVELLDDLKLEEDIYGAQPVKKEHNDKKFEATESPEPELTPEGKKAKYSKPIPDKRHRRHRDDIETEDRVLVSMIDSGWPWEY